MSVALQTEDTEAVFGEGLGRSSLASGDLGEGAPSATASRALSGGGSNPPGAAGAGAEGRHGAPVSAGCGFPRDVAGLDPGDSAPWSDARKHPEHLTDSEAAELLRGVDSGVRPDLSRRGYRFVKRTFDLIASGAVVVVLLVPGLVLSAVICVSPPGAGPLYGQLRAGRVNADGTYRLFRMWKFRSMVPHADEMLDDLRASNEADSPLFKMCDDPRVIPGVGRFIRRHSLASVIIGTPGDGEPTKSFSHPANSSLDLQLCERRPELASHAEKHYNSCHFLSVDLFRGLLGGEKGLAAGVFEKLADAFRAECTRLCWAVAA